MYSRWEHMLALAQSDPDGAFDIAKAVLGAELRADFPHVAVEDVKPFRSHVLTVEAPKRETRPAA